MLVVCICYCYNFHIFLSFASKSMSSQKYNTDPEAYVFLVCDGTSTISYSIFFKAIMKYYLVLVISLRLF